MACFDADEFSHTSIYEHKQRKRSLITLKNKRTPNVAMFGSCQAVQDNPKLTTCFIKGSCLVMEAQEARTSKDLLNYYPKNSNALIDGALFNPVQWHLRPTPSTL